MWMLQKGVSVAALLHVRVCFKLDDTIPHVGVGTKLGHLSWCIRTSLILGLQLGR